MVLGTKNLGVLGKGQENWHFSFMVEPADKAWSILGIRPALWLYWLCVGLVGLAAGCVIHCGGGAGGQRVFFDRAAG